MRRHCSSSLFQRCSLFLPHFYSMVDFQMFAYKRSSHQSRFQSQLSVSIVPFLVYSLHRVHTSQDPLQYFHNFRRSSPSGQLVCPDHLGWPSSSSSSASVFYSLPWGFRFHSHYLPEMRSSRHYVHHLPRILNYPKRLLRPTEELPAGVCWSSRWLGFQSPVDRSPSSRHWSSVPLPELLGRRNRTGFLSCALPSGMHALVSGLKLESGTDLHVPRISGGWSRRRLAKLGSTS